MTTGPGQRQACPQSGGQVRWIASPGATGRALAERLDLCP